MVPVLVAEMGKAFPELVRAEALITEMLRLEETNFRRTLDRGLRLLEEETGRLGVPASRCPGEVAFRLYDTYGFPLDLTQDALRAQGRSVDTAGFTAAMAAAARGGAGGLEGLGRGRGRAGLVRAPRARTAPTEFLGYDDRPRPRAVIVALVRDGELVDAAAAGSEVAGRRQPDPVLRRIGRPDRRHRHDPLRRRGRAGHRHAEAARRLDVHLGRLEGGTLRVGDTVELRSTARAATGCAAPTRPPTCCTRRCAATSART